MKLYSALQIDEIGTKIAAKIKAITAKTNLLKTAAYRDVGTTDGTVPEFVGSTGIGGFGFGGYSKNLGTGVNLDTLPRVNAIYGLSKNNVVVGLPADMQTYRYNSEMTLQVLASANEFHATQVLTANAYKPPGTSPRIRNPVIFTRCSSFDDWGPWERVSGQLMDADVSSDVVGDDLVVNSITAGATSPKIAFEIVRLDITYANFGYNEDGMAPNDSGYGASGYQLINSSIPAARILDLSLRLYGAIYKNYGDPSIGFAPEDVRGSGAYIKSTPSSTGAGYLVQVKTEAHSIESLGNTNDSGQIFFNDGYAELFVTYKVD